MDEAFEDNKFKPCIYGESINIRRRLNWTVGKCLLQIDMGHQTL